MKMTVTGLFSFFSLVAIFPGPVFKPSLNGFQSNDHSGKV